MATDQTHDDADELLHWLNTHSVKVSDGVPATLLQQMWLRSTREAVRLKVALEWLFENDMVSVTQGLEPPHLRFTPKGYLRLLAAMDEARLSAKMAVAADDARPTRQPPPAQEKPAAAPAPKAPPAMALLQAPDRFLEAGKPPTELGLRNQILYIFRDLKLAAGQQLIAMTLSRYWQEMGLRGGDLRVGIDVLIRDGFLTHAMKRYENYWLLTAAGARYAYGPVTPAALLALAEPLKKVEDGIKPALLRRAALGAFGSPPNRLPFSRLYSSFNGSRDALLHGLDLLWKDGLAAFHPEAELLVELTESGLAARS